MFHRRQYAMAMGVYLQCVANYAGLATRSPRRLHVSLVFYAAANARRYRSRGFQYRCRRCRQCRCRRWRRRRAQTSTWRRKYPSAVLFAQSAPHAVVHGASEKVQVSRECEGGTGCRNCLKKLVACISPYLRLAPTIPAGSRVARKYEGGKSDFLLLCAFQRHPTLSNVFFGRHVASTG